MARYRKIPVVIEAEEFVALAHYLGKNAAPNIEGVCWCGSGVLDDEHKCLPHIHTLEGIHWVSDGDFIITGVKGEKYPCKPDIFALTYEPANG